MAVEETRRKMPTSRLDPEFGPWLKGMRSQRGMTVEDLANEGGLHRSTLTMIENQRLEAAFSMETFVRMAKGLDVELGYLLYKAGFDIGRAGVDMARLARVEDIIREFAEQESSMRLALAEACEKFSPEDPIRAGLTNALLSLDLLGERIRRDKDLRGSRPVAGHNPTRMRSRGGTRAWTDRDRAFLLANPQMSHKEAGNALGRSQEAVRFFRTRKLYKTNEGGGS